MSTKKNNKFELVKRTANDLYSKFPSLLQKNVDGDFYQIRALRDIPGKAKAGEFGGFIRSEASLNWEDNSWLDDNSVVLDVSYIGGESYIRNSTISGTSIINNAYIEHSRIYNLCINALDREISKNIDIKKPYSIYIVSSYIDTVAAQQGQPPAVIIIYSARISRTNVLCPMSLTYIAGIDLTNTTVYKDAYITINSIPLRICDAGVPDSYDHLANEGLCQINHHVELVYKSIDYSRGFGYNVVVDRELAGETMPKSRMDTIDGETVAIRWHNIMPMPSPFMTMPSQLHAYSAVITNMVVMAKTIHDCNDLQNRQGAIVIKIGDKTIESDHVSLDFVDEIRNAI